MRFNTYLNPTFHEQPNHNDLSSPVNSRNPTTKRPSHLSISFTYKMAFSRESSPENNSSPNSPAQLTPTSKVKALLASFDNDSDDERIPSLSREKLSSLPANKPTAYPTSGTDDTGLKTKPQGRLDSTGNDEDEDEDEDDDIVRPMGRMAARMQVTEDNEDNSEDEGQHDSHDARERVRKLLMTKGPAPEAALSDKDSADNEDSDTSVVFRKRKVRVSRRTTPTPSPRRRSASPGLFVSPEKAVAHASESSDDDELPKNPLENDSFKALVERKRQERLEKEARQAEEKAKQQAALAEEDEVVDDFVEERLTQQTKPTRKASKKATEAIAQETQRLSRNMQLTHQAKTKKKFTKADLFKVYNFRSAGGETKSEEGPTSSSPAPHSDVEMHSTPPTSPASHGSDAEKPPVISNSRKMSNAISNPANLLNVEIDNKSTLDDALTTVSHRSLGKGKGKAVDEALPGSPSEKKPVFKKRSIRVLPSIIPKVEASLDSESDLEILPANPSDTRTQKLDAIFDRIPAKQAKESRSHQTLKMLAHLKSPGKQNLGRNHKPSLTSTELHVSLQQRARQQAALARQEKEEELRARGVIVPTAEEKQKVLAEIEEDLIARARREGEELRRQEKAIARQEKINSGETASLEGSSDDEDWNEEKNEIHSGSGSEDDEDSGSDASGEQADGDDESDEDDMAREGSDQEEAIVNNPMFDDEADEDDEDNEASLPVKAEVVEPADMKEDQEDDDIPVNQPSRRVRKSNVISDDEDEGTPSVETPLAQRTKLSTSTRKESPNAPTSVLRSATKTFIPGLTVAGPAGLGLTQIFAGTMDDSQFDEGSAPDFSMPDVQQDSLAFLRGLPAPDLPPFVPTMQEDSQDVIVDSQAQANQPGETQTGETQTQGFQLGFSQSQVHGFDSLVDPRATQFSEMPEATQDVGFQYMTPIKGRFVEAPPSTADTVVMDQGSALQQVMETPVVKKKGKLRRRAQVATFSDAEDSEDVVVEDEQEDDFEISANVFDVMRKASKKKDVVVDEFDKKTSKAKEMVHDQAEESEDDYAGLGGASDEGSDEEEDEYVKEIIDDEGERCG